MEFCYFSLYKKVLGFVGREKWLSYYYHHKENVVLRKMAFGEKLHQHPEFFFQVISLVLFLMSDFT